MSLFYNFFKERKPDKVYLIRFINNLYPHRTNVDHRTIIYSAGDFHQICLRTKELMKELIQIARPLRMEI